MSNLAGIQYALSQAKIADDAESVSILAAEENRILLEETDWIPSVIERARSADDVETVNFLESWLDASAPAPAPEETIVEQPPAPALASVVPQQDDESNFFENVIGGSSTGFTGLFETSALGAATLLEEEAELKAIKVIKDVGDALSTDIGDPDSLTYQISQGLGSIGAMIGTGIAAAYAAPASLGALGTGLLSTGVAATLTGSAGAGEASERARAYGATEEQRNTAALKGLGIGTLEVATPPVARFIKIPGITDFFKKLGGESIGLFGRLRSAVVGGVGEGIQEATAAILQNLTAQGYDPEQVLLDAGVAKEGEIGAYSGGIFQFVADLASGKRGRVRVAGDRVDAEETTEPSEALDLEGGDTTPDEDMSVARFEAMSEEDQIAYTEAKSIELEAKARTEAEAEAEAEAVVEEAVPVVEEAVPVVEEAVVPVAEAVPEAVVPVAEAVPEAEVGRSAVVPETTTTDAVIPKNVKAGDKIDIFDISGNPYTATVEAVSGLGGVRVLNQEGNSVLLDQDFSATTVNVRNPKYKLDSKGVSLNNVTGLSNTSLDELSGPQLLEIKNVLEGRMVDPNFLGQSAALTAALQDLNAVKLRIKENTKSETKPKAQEGRSAVVPETKTQTVSSFAELDNLIDRPSLAVEAAVIPTINPETGKFKLKDSEKFVSKHDDLEKDTSKLKILRNTPRLAQAPRKGTKTEKEAYTLGSRVQRYLQQFDTPMDGILSAIYDVADPKSKVYTRPDKGTIDVDPLAANLEFTGGENAKAVLKWAKDNLSVETNAQIDSKLGTATKELEKTEEGIIQNEEQAIKADQLKLEGRAEDQAIDIADAQENATIARNALEADEAQKIVDKGGSRGNIDNTSLEAGLDVDIDIEDIKPAREKRARENKRVAAAEKKERKPVNKAQRAKDSADENFSRLLANDKLDFTSTNNKKVLTKVAKRNLDRAEEFANASNDPEGNLIKLAKFLSERGEGAKRVAKVQAKLDKDKPVKPPTAKQTMVDNIYAKFEGVKGITKETIAGAFNFVTMDVLQSKRIATAKKYFDTATPADIKEAAQGYIYSKESDWLPLELDVETAAALDSDVSKGVKSSLKAGDLLLALESLVKGNKNPRVKQITKTIREAAATLDSPIKVELLNSKELAAKGFAPSTDDSALAGAYDANTNTVFINTDVPITTHTVLHEVTHALTAKALSNPNLPVTKRLQKLFDDLNEGISEFYRVTSLQEFVAEAFSNPDFQLALSEMDVKGKRYNALQSFYDTIVNFIRSKMSRGPLSDAEFRGSALTAVDQAILAILPNNPNSRGQEVISNMLITPESSRKFIESISEAAASGTSKNKFVSTIKQYGVSLTDFNLAVFLKTIDAQIVGDVARRLGYGDIGYRFQELFETQREELNQATNKVDLEIESFRKWVKSTGTSGLLDKFNNLIYSLDHGATIYDVDPSLSKGAAVLKYGKRQAEDGKYLIDVWSEQQAEWNALGDEGQKQFNSQRKMYQKLHEKLLDAIFGQIDIVVGDNKVLSKQMKDRVAKELSKGSLDVYWPLVRDGEYKLSYVTRLDNRDGTFREEPVFLMYETKAERDAMYVEVVNNKAKGNGAGTVITEKTVDGKLVETKPRKINGTFKKENWDNSPSGSFVGDILQILKANNIDVKLQEEVMSTYIAALPENSLAKSLQGRKTVMGFEPDADKGMQQKAYQLSTQIVKMTNNAKIRALQDEVTRIQGAGQPSNAEWNEENSPRYGAMFDLIAEEMNDRGKFARNGATGRFLGFKTDTGAKFLNQVGFIYTIGFNASSAAVNLSQIGLVAIPYLSPRFGFDATFAAFLSASRSTLSNYNSIDTPYDRKEVEVVKNGRTTIEIQYTVKQSVKDKIYLVSGGPFGAKSKEAADAKLAELERYIPLIKKAGGRGLIKTTVDMDQSGFSSLEGGPKKTKLQALRSLTSWGAASAYAFQHAEKFNRQTTLMATYDLSMQQLEEGTRFYSSQQGKLIDVPKSTAAKQELAAAEAVYLTQATNGGAILETTPSFLREGFGRVVGMYKSFGARMYGTMIQTAYASIDKNNPDATDAEVKQLRSEARQQMFAVSVSSILAAGVQGWPLYGLAAMLASIFYDEEEDSFRTDTRKNIGEIAYKGPLSYYTGVDVSQRIALTNLIFNENRYLNDPTDEELVALYGGGVAWSTFKRLRRGMEDWGKGNYKRAFENFLPAGLTNVFRNIPKVGRLAEEGGYYTRAGKEIYGGLTLKDKLLGSVGFPPLNYMNNSEDASQVKSIDVAIGRAKQKIVKLHTQSILNNDLDRLYEAKDKLLKFNARHPIPRVQITNETLSKSLASAYAAQKYYYKGVRLTPTMWATLFASSQQLTEYPRLDLLVRKFNLLKEPDKQ